MRRAMMLVALGVLVASAPARGDVVAAKTVHDFGTVEQGSPVEHAFALKNIGRSMVRIEGTKSSCGCTVAADDGQLVRPGAITWVRVRLDTAALAGRTTKTIILRTSDARTPAVQLALAGVVLTDLTVTPTPVYFGRVYRDEAARRELVVAPGRPAIPGVQTTPYTVSSVETDSPVLRTYVVAGDKPDQQKVVIEVDGEAPLGRFTDHIIIRTTSPRQPAITVPVFGSVLG
jgi:Protein of unknown function (DUF1573)